MTSVAGLPANAAGGGPLAAVRRQGISGRAMALLLIVVAAYPYSLLTLARGLGYQTPLAYLALVPVLAVLVGWVRLVRANPPLPVHDRQVDLIVATVCIAVAVLISAGLPSSLRTTFWTSRFDLLGLPFFAAGVVTLLYGVRRLWALKLPIAFLVLAWPVPYLALLTGVLGALTDLTAAAVRLTAVVIPNVQASTSDMALFYVGPPGQAWAVSIGGVCAGVNGLVGFVLIALAILAAVGAPVVRGTAWLATGLVVVFIVNVVRILIVLAVGTVAGESVAIDMLHPVIGIVIYNIAVVLMVAVAGRFGLRFSQPLRTRPASLPVTAPPVRRPAPALVLASFLALVLGTLNVGYARYEAISDNLGEARLARFDMQTASFDGWSLQYVGAYAEAREFFGPSGSWNRMLIASSAGATLQASIPVYMDVVETADAGALNAYGIAACYQFHGFQIETMTDVDLGGGTTGQIIDYHNRDTSSDWSAVWWEWPFRDGDRTAYERVVLFLVNGPSATYAGAGPALPSTTGPGGAAPGLEASRFAATDAFLAALARQVVRERTAVVANR